MICEEFIIDGNHGKICGLLKGSWEECKEIILCVHGNPNGDLKGNDKIFDLVSENLVPLGYLVVQFSLYGSAPSSGSALNTTIKKQVDDFRSILIFVKKRFNKPLHIMCESAGATIAAQAWDMEALSYIMLWPAFDLCDTDLRTYLSSEWKTVAAKNGFIQDGDIILSKDYLDELGLIDFEPLFDIPAVPTILIHARKDSEVPFAQSLKAISRSFGTITLVAVQNGDHGLKSLCNRNLVLDTIKKWLAKI